MQRFDSTFRVGIRGILGLVLAFSGADALAQRKPDGFLHTEKGVRFPIGFYQLPDRDETLRDMAAAGINLVRAGKKADLDRCKEAGLFGWMPLAVETGPTDALKKLVLEVRDHPALAVWEGPDEIVWNFTTYSGLAETANITRDDWTFQRPNAVAYAKKESAKILPKMRDAIKFVRDNDPKHRPFWINEAGGSDPIYVRQYMDSIDVTGCDVYPVKAEGSNLPAVGKMTDVWRKVGREKPVWMVLQAASWHKVRPVRYKEPAYPSFEQTRFMAWDSIVHGARGILYWGSQYVDDGRFIPSIYAMTAELAALEPFLLGLDAEVTEKLRAEDTTNPPEWPSVRLIEPDLEGKTKLGVRMIYQRIEDDSVIVLVNEDDIPHHGVEVRGLANPIHGMHLIEREFHLLYGDESVKITDQGELMTRMQPYEVKLFATSRKWESPRRSGRDFR